MQTKRNEIFFLGQCKTMSSFFTINCVHAAYDWHGLLQHLNAEFIILVPENGTINKGAHYHGVLVSTDNKNTLRSKIRTWFLKHYDITFGPKMLNVKQWTNGWTGAAYLWKERPPLKEGVLPEDLPSDEAQFLTFKEEQKKKHDALKKETQEKTKNATGKTLKTQWDFIKESVQLIINKGLGKMHYTDDEIVDNLIDLYLANRQTLPSPQNMVRLLYSITIKLDASATNHLTGAKERYKRSVAAEHKYQLLKRSFE